MTTSDPHLTRNIARPDPAAHHLAGRKAALDALAAALDSRDFTATLYADGPVPYLHISSTHAQLSEDVLVAGQSYMWPWGQPIAAVGNAKAAADKIRYVLAATPEPSRG